MAVGSGTGGSELGSRAAVRQRQRRWWHDSGPTHRPV